MCINPGLVRAKIHHLLKLGPPNSDKICNTPWLRSLSILGLINLHLQGQIQLQLQISPHFNFSEQKITGYIKVRISKFGSELNLNTVKILVDFALDWPWFQFHFNFEFGTYFFHESYFHCFILYLVRQSLVNICDTMVRPSDCFTVSIPSWYLFN